jgi:hypothetical protein
LQKNNSIKIWQYHKNKFIFALQKIIEQIKKMLRTQKHIEAVNWVSLKGLVASCGAYIDAS